MGLPIRMSKSSVPLQAAHLFGADTESVLSEELGLSGTELQALSRSGAIGISSTAYAAAE